MCDSSCMTYHGQSRTAAVQHLLTYNNSTSESHRGFHLLKYVANGKHHDCYEIPSKVTQFQGKGRMTIQETLILSNEEKVQIVVQYNLGIQMRKVHDSTF